MFSSLCRQIFSLNTQLTTDTSDEEEEEDYSIVYEVPFKNASREMVLSSSTSFGKFLVTLGQKMEVSVTHLTAVGYIPSYKPKNSKPVPKLLETSEAYERMMDDIDDYRTACKEKNRGRGKVKPFTIRIVDTSEVVEGRGNPKVSVAFQLQTTGTNLFHRRKARTYNQRLPLNPRTFKSTNSWPTLRRSMHARSTRGKHAMFSLPGSIITTQMQILPFGQH